MQVVQVDVVNAKSRDRFGESLVNIFGFTAYDPLSGSEAELCSEEDIIALAGAFEPIDM